MSGRAMNRQTVIKYNLVARTLHWIIGVAIIVEIVLGLGHDAMEGFFPTAIPIHKATGLTILVLSLFRLLWRLMHSIPPLPASLPHWQALAARSTHWLFYFLMIAMPLSGWIMTSASKYPLDWFGLFPIAKWPVAKGDPIVGFAAESHEIMGLFLIPLILLHIGAALYHHFALKDDVALRML